MIPEKQKQMCTIHVHFFSFWKLSTRAPVLQYLLTGDRNAGWDSVTCKFFTVCIQVVTEKRGHYMSLLNKGHFHCFLSHTGAFPLFSCSGINSASVQTLLSPHNFVKTSLQWSVSANGPTLEEYWNVCVDLLKDPAVLMNFEVLCV